jgi:hypothetical protein
MNEQHTPDAAELRAQRTAERLAGLVFNQIVNAPYNERVGRFAAIIREEYAAIEATARGNCDFCDEATMTSQTIAELEQANRELADALSFCDEVTMTSQTIAELEQANRELADALRDVAGGFRNNGAIWDEVDSVLAKWGKV